MAQTEQELRVQLAACYRIFDYMGWSEMIYNHITVKVPGARTAFPDQPIQPALQRGKSLQSGQG